jgi:hypothetical protein
MPAATIEAPISPPNSACDELEGSPSSHVSRFQMIAPISPAKITTGVTRVSSTSPLEIVLATSTDRKAPTRFSTPAIATAAFGLSAPVAMDVAMALAVSWNPLVKSKISAVATTTTTMRVRSTRAPLLDAAPVGAVRGESIPQDSRPMSARATGPGRGRHQRPGEQ